MSTIALRGPLRDFDPRKPTGHPDDICSRCHNRGLFVIPKEMPERDIVLCLHQCEENGLPGHCPKCKGLQGPQHTRWCDGSANWCTEGDCIICDELRERLAP